MNEYWVEGKNMGCIDEPEISGMEISTNEQDPIQIIQMEDGEYN